MWLPGITELHGQPISRKRSAALQLELPLFFDLFPPSIVPGPGTTPPSKSRGGKSAGQARQILLLERPVTYSLARRKRRTIGLLIDHRGLTVSAPARTPLYEIENFILEKARWILTKLEEWSQRTPNTVRYWRASEPLMFLGESLVVQINEVPKKQIGASRNADILTVGVTELTRPDAIRLQVKQWLRQEAESLFTQRLAVYCEKMNLSVPRLFLSSAETRWGSCNGNGRVSLNWRLIHLPIALIDYVVVHELAHFRQMNHSAKFWAEVERSLPDYRTTRDELKARAHSLPLL